MEINGKQYDLTKVNGEVSKKQLAENNSLYSTIFEYLDNLDGTKDNKLSKKNLQDIFAILQSMDNENGIKDGKLSDKEFSIGLKKYFKDLKISPNDLKAFVIKLLNQNEVNGILNIVTKNKNKTQTKKEDGYNFRLGQKHNGIRTIGPDSVATKIGSNTRLASENREQFSSLYLEIENAISTVNQTGYSGFKQGHRGDCYFVQEINSINNTENGKQILNMNIKKNSDNSYLLTLPGAVLLKNDLKRRGFEAECEITGIYKITPEAVVKLKKQAGKAYSEGNIKVMLLELAMESYREELARTNKKIGKKENIYSAEGAGRTYDKDNLRGGVAWDAAFILTGQKSEVYTANKQKYSNAPAYKPGKYGFITREQMEAQSSQELPYATKGLSEVTSVTHNEASLRAMLNRMEGNDSNYAMSVGFRTEVNGPDGVTKKNSTHALSVLKVTPTTVYILNPWYKDKKGEPCIEPIPRKDFEKMSIDFSYSKMDKKEIKKTHIQILKSNLANDLSQLFSTNNPHQKPRHNENNDDAMSRKILNALKQKMKK